LYPTQPSPVLRRALTPSRLPHPRITWFTIITLIAVAGAALAALGSPTTAAARPQDAAPTRTLSSGETALLNRITAARRAAGLPALTLDNRLIDLARSRSNDMAIRGYFDHYTPDGKSFLDMMRGQRIPFRMAGEIIAQNNYGAAQTAEQAYLAYKNSTEHNRIILRSNWRSVGLGQAVDRNGMYYYTVIFSQPR
jgi:uncharacterized protein YkwD